MKRYDLCEGEGCGCHMEEDGGGDYYLVSDVERTMIPRPDAEAARKAVYRLEQASHTAGRELKIYGGISAETKNELCEARAAVLALMGVE